MEAETAAAPELVEDDEHDSKEKVLLKYFLQEWEVLKAILDRIVQSGGDSEPSDIHRIRSIIDKYQEQGQLLEPYLESIISPLMYIIQSKTIQMDSSSDGVLETVKPLSIIIYSLITVCGYKSVVKFFPHQVSDLEPAISLLEKCHQSASLTSLRQESTGEMELKCVVLLWLYILVLIPFDISSIDTSIAHIGNLAEPEHSPLVLKILGFSKDYLSDAGPMRRIAGLLLSRLLTRPDMPKIFSSFFEWTHEVLLSEANSIKDHFKLLGLMEALSSIFKVGSRTILVDVASTTWNDVLLLKKSPSATRSPLIRKFVVKLSQRVGLACLPPRPPTWQYVVRYSSLGKQFSRDTSFNFCSETQNERDLDTEDMDVPGIIEEIMEQLLSGLRDSDTVVRWSAAKGIGRITARLTSLLAEDVLTSVLDLFSPGEGDGSWHGGCLALAELARRGLLVPACLPNVVPVIVKALHYDVKRGPHSVGSHVRDAAAYVCWAFGRAYSHSDMKAILEIIAPHLLTVACYDREVNCRRAAAAAFQENVGRQGSYPHGIEIVNVADYFSLASRTNSYLHVAVYIAQYEEYLYPFIEDLTNHKISHWDKTIRELAAAALSLLSKYNSEYFASHVLTKLIPCTLSSDLCLRHGATLAAGELVLSLHQSGFAFSEENQKCLSGVVPAIEKARLYRGKGGEIMRASVSRFVECISLANISLIKKTKRSLLDTLNENLKHPNALIQAAAVDALKHFFPAYCVGFEDAIADEIVEKYLGLLTDSNAAARRGAALAIGILPLEYLASRWQNILKTLSSSCLIQGNPDDWDAEARVNAVRGLVSVCETLTGPKISLLKDAEEELLLFELIKKDVMQILFKALDDYAVDNRGDVGSWVREAAIIGLEKCTYILCRKDFSMSSKPPQGELLSITLKREEVKKYSTELFDTEIATNIVGGIAKQAVEKLDKIREIAAKTLQRIVYSKKCSRSSIPHIDVLEEIIPDDADLEWGVPSYSFPRLVKLLQCNCYSKQVLSGLVVSVGGLQESLRKAAAAALLEYVQVSEPIVQDMGSAREYMLSVNLLWVLQHHQKVDRIVVPGFKTIEILFSKKVFLNMKGQTEGFCTGILESLKIELKATRDFAKLFTGLSLLGYIASLSEPVNISAFAMLLSHIGHRYPKIRKAAADQVYLVILQNTDLISANVMESALEMLLETCWEGDIEEAKRQQRKLSAMAGLEYVVSIRESKKTESSKNVTTDENISYSSLVGFSGF